MPNTIDVVNCKEKIEATTDEIVERYPKLDREVATEYAIGLADVLDKLLALQAKLAEAGEESNNEK